MNEVIAAVQKALGFTGKDVDGVWGKRSQAALDAAKIPKPSPPQDAAPGPWTVDERSESAIGTLHRLVQPKARQLVQLAAQNGITVKVTSGTRTYDEQNKLFAQGGVTKARGGYSNHNFGLALDLTIFKNGEPVWESPQYQTLGKLGKSLGFSWGGDWSSFKDEPHFEVHPPWASNMSENQILAELRRRHDNGIDVFA